MQITNGTRALVTGANGESVRPSRAPCTRLAPSVARCMEEAGPVDVLVTNAALPSSGPLVEFDTAQIDRAVSGADYFDRLHAERLTRYHTRRLAALG